MIYKFLIKCFRVRSREKRRFLENFYSTKHIQQNESYIEKMLDSISSFYSHILFLISNIQLALLFFITRLVIYGADSALIRPAKEDLAPFIKLNRFLKSISFLIPNRKFREAFLGDLYELTIDMKEQGCSKFWIYAVSLWHIGLCLWSSIKMSLKERLGLEPGDKEVNR